MKRLIGRKKYLKIFFGSYTPSKNDQHLPQGLFKETNSDINFFRLHFTYSKANSQASHKEEMKTLSKKHYRAR